MGSPMNPLITYIYMEHFEEVALQTAQTPPRLWRKFVAYTFVVQWLEHRENFLKHINSIDMSIKFTLEDTCPDGSIP